MQYSVELQHYMRRHVLAPGGLVVVDIDPLELEVAGALVAAGGVDAVLIRDDLPELW